MAVSFIVRRLSSAVYSPSTFCPILGHAPGMAAVGGVEHRLFSAMPPAWQLGCGLIEVFFSFVFLPYLLCLPKKQSFHRGGELRLAVFCQLLYLQINICSIEGLSRPL